MKIELTGRRQACNTSIEINGTIQKSSCVVLRQFTSFQAERKLCVGWRRNIIADATCMAKPCLCSLSLRM